MAWERRNLTRVWERMQAGRSQVFSSFRGINTNQWGYIMHLIIYHVSVELVQSRLAHLLLPPAVSSSIVLLRCVKVSINPKPESNRLVWCWWLVLYFYDFTRFWVWSKPVLVLVLWLSNSKPPFLNHCNGLNIKL